MLQFPQRLFRPASAFRLSAWSSQLHEVLRPSSSRRLLLASDQRPHTLLDTASAPIGLF